MLLTFFTVLALVCMVSGAWWFSFALKERISMETRIGVALCNVMAVLGTTMCLLGVWGVAQTGAEIMLVLLG